MTWTSIHIYRDDEIRVDTTSTPGYVHLTLGVDGATRAAAALMMPLAKAAELNAALGEALATPDEQDGGA